MSKYSYQPSISSQISHNLRIPITEIMGMVYFLQKTVLTEQQNEHLSFIQASAERLLITQTEIGQILSNRTLRKTDQ